MRSRWERLARLAALLLPVVALLATTIDPSLRERYGEAASWLCFALGMLALAWFLVVVIKTVAPKHSDGPWLQSLAPDDQKVVRRSWRIGAPVPANLTAYIRHYARTQEVALHRGGWTVVAVGIFNVNTAFGDGTLRWLGIVMVVYFVAIGLGLDLLHARWRRVLSELPRVESAPADTTHQGL